MSDRRCATCGNSIPEWANGVCFACHKLQPSWVWRRSKRMRPRPERRRTCVPDDINIAVRSKGLKPIKPYNIPLRIEAETRPLKLIDIRPSEWKRLARDYLNPLNSLLRDIYGQETHITDLLFKSGVSQDQLKSWLKNYYRVYHYLCQFENDLYGLLKQECPNCNPRVLWDHYIGHLSVQQIARKANSRACDVLNTLESLLAYLRSESGKFALEQILVKIYRNLNVE